MSRTRAAAPAGTGALLPDAARLRRALLRWYRRDARVLPWRTSREPYGVWVSEVMLQQTQVSTALPYWERFLARLPDVRALAAAPLDDVLHLWAGRGYYTRARNLHRAAQRIVEECGGELPREHAALQSLPGLGRSTAAAVLALALDAHHAILDGNVKRVLARVFAVEGAPNERAVEQRLWALAEQETPAENVADYTQAIMDLGATLCTRHNPACERCPLASQCIANATGRQAELPAPRVRAARRLKHVVLLAACREDGGVLLVQRPARGIWGGLWSLPEFQTEADARTWGGERLAGACWSDAPLTPVRHAFTHFDLEMRPLSVRCEGERPRVADGPPQAHATLWYRPDAPAAVGLPAPIARLLSRLQAGTPG